jgi:hypothetical protein
MVNFTLSGLNQNFTLGVSGELAAAAAAIIDASSTAIFQVKLSDMLKVFKFQTDAFDVNNVDASDIKYYVFDASNAWPTNLVLNPAHAHTLSDPILTDAEIPDDKKFVKHDFVRYLALKLFNTPYGVDLFSNETELLENIVTKGAIAHTSIKSALSAVSVTGASGTGTGTDAAGHKYLTNAYTTAAANFSRELMQQIAHSAPQRFHDTANSSGIQSVPLAVNDTINFKVSITPADGQNALTLRPAAFDSRTYKIQLLLTNDSPVNVAPTESGSASAYPYHA